MKIPSKTTDALISELIQRDHDGLNKYGVTIDRDDLKASEWVQHAIEEQIDNLKYMKRLKDKLEEAGL